MKPEDDYTIIEFGTDVGVRFPTSDGAILHLKPGESIEIKDPTIEYYKMRNDLFKKWQDDIVNDLLKND